MPEKVKEYPICAVCGLPITDQQKTSKVHARCRAEWQRMRDRERSSAREKLKTPRTCEWCGKEFMPAVWSQLTCGSKSCQYKQKKKAEAKRKSGETRDYQLIQEYAMPDPWKPYTDDRQNVWPALSTTITGYTSFDCPECDPMTNRMETEGVWFEACAVKKEKARKAA